MRSRLRYAAITILITSVPVALMLLAASGEAEPGQTPEPLAQMILYGAAEWYPWAILAPFIDRLVRRSRPRNRGERMRIIATHVAMVAGFILIHGSAMQLLNEWLHPPFTRPYWRSIRSEAIPDVILYSVIAGGFTVAEARRRQTEIAERLRAQVAEARLDALRQQLNPHFLFNTLNHIVSELRGLRRPDVEPALNMLLALSDLLRDVLRERAQLIPLRDEVRMLERYLEIERARFGDRLQATVTLEPKTLDALVPSLLLQPLVENAMRHGVSAADGRCQLALSVRAKDARLLVEVRDAGPGFDPSKADPGTGIGLRNSAERLAYLYGDDHRFELKTLEDGGLSVEIDLPLKRS